MYYTNSQSIVKIKQMNEDFELNVFGAGLQLGIAGDYIATKLNGDKFVLPKQFFEELYVPVTLVEKTVDTDNMAQGYQEMADINTEEANAVYTYNKLFRGKAF